MASTQDFLGPYQLVRLIRSGATTQVWEARKAGETDRVALKVLLAEHRANKVEIAQLKHESRVGQNFDHPYVIKIFEFRGSHGRPFIAMQLFNARNLKQELRERPNYVAVNVPEIIRKCAEGLNHVHERGWIHCDIKPDNFLVDEQANVKLIDFSIAQPARRGLLAGLTLGRRPVQGTRSYMSPEQIRGKSLTVSSDIYSLGCVLFELVTGRLPFSAGNPDELLTKHLRSPVPSLQAYNRAISSEFGHLVHRMMAKEVAGRPASLKDFLREYSRLRVYRAGMRPHASGGTTTPS